MYISKEQIQEKKELLKNLFPEFKFSVTNDKHHGFSVKAVQIPVEIKYDEVLVELYGEQQESRVGELVESSTLGHLTDLKNHPQYNLILFVINYGLGRGVEGLLEENVEKKCFSNLEGFHVGNKFGCVEVKERKVSKKLQGNTTIELLEGGKFKATKGEFEFVGAL